MKRLLILFVVMLSICMEGIAQISGMPIGYCDGEWNNKGTITSTKKNEWVSAAIYIPAGAINVYSGNHIDSIKVALASKLNIESLKVWLRSDLNGENLAEGTMTTSTNPAMQKGWNTIALDKPYNIQKGDKGLYIGYSFLQKSASFGISTLGNSTTNGLFVKLPGEDWTDKSAEGTLCVEALVYGENLPKINLALLSVEAQKVFVIEKGKMSITGKVKNIATQTISGFDVQAKFDGVDKPYTSHIDMTLPYKDSKYFNVTMPPDIKDVGTGKGKVTVTITNITEGEDEDPTDNVLSDTFKIVQHDFTRKILVEEFTTEECTNCPAMASKLHNALEKDEFKDNMIVACHHSGYYTDWLTQPCDPSYLWFFNAGGATYAPAIMINRYNYGETTPVIFPQSQGELEAKLSEGLSEPAFVSVNVKASVISGKPEKVSVNVSGTKSVEKLCDNPRLVVYLLEDNIPAHSQAGAGAGYIQNHVKRAYNSTWGDNIEWNGNDYTYNCEFELSTGWNKENLQVIAFIYNYDENDPTNCAVDNAGAIRYKDFEEATGINEVNSKNCVNAHVDYFTLSGEKVSPTDLTKGIYIVKKNNMTRKVVIGK